jgi:molybdenum cofactor cytidylyltransferase
MPAIRNSSRARRSARFFAILPAAGRSVRMGQPKLLLPWGQATLIEHVLGQWLASRASRVVIVVHPEDTQLAELCRGAGAETVVPDTPPDEMKVSAAHGLAAIRARYNPAACDAWLLAPADMPRLSAALIDACISCHDATSLRIVVPTHGGRRGHPVLFPWPLADEVPKLSEHEGLNALLKRHPPLEMHWPDDSALADVDSPEDYRRWRNAEEESS